MSCLKIAVVGSVNLDVLGKPAGPFKPRDSLIGSVQFRCGGVGHNIAAQAVRTGADVSLYTVFSQDGNGDWLIQSCLNEGIRIDHCPRVSEASSVYLAIHDQAGDMLAAINDMGLISALTPAVLDQMIPSINTCNVCVFDANLSEECMERLCSTVTAPLVCDPVSAVKSKRVLPFLKKLSAIKPNLLEAIEMTGASTPEECADRLIMKGVQSVFVSLGKEGLYYASENSNGFVSPPRVSTAVQTGAGDALTAGIAYGIGSNKSVKECALLGMETVSRFLHIK